ncbi:hypothetical protein KCU91_g47, partial [Aureobasidium melanogenum]
MHGLGIDVIVTLSPKIKHALDFAAVSSRLLALVSHPSLLCRGPRLLSFQSDQRRDELADRGDLAGLCWGCRVGQRQVKTRARVEEDDVASTYVPRRKVTNSEFLQINKKDLLWYCRRTKHSSIRLAPSW